QVGKFSCSFLGTFRLTFISCIDEQETIIKALEMGGDNYLVKPFNFRELNARIQSNLRRVDFDSEWNNNIVNKRIIVNDIIIYLESRTVYKKNKRVYLSPTEFDILTYMINHPGKTLSYDDIFKTVWNGDSLGDIRTVMVHVSNLRKKIEEDISNPKYIKTIRKFGYILQGIFRNILQEILMTKMGTHLRCIKNDWFFTNFNAIKNNRLLFLCLFTHPILTKSISVTNIHVILR
ncbi:MAG: winged helix-turn-helix domain-containing protein, partial [Eubacteriaceae bacterium]